MLQAEIAQEMPHGVVEETRQTERVNDRHRAHRRVARLHARMEGNARGDRFIT